MGIRKGLNGYTKWHRCPIVSVQSPKLAQGEEAEELKNQECGPEAACCMGHVQGFGKQRETRVLFHENIRK